MKPVLLLLLSLSVHLLHAENYYFSTSIGDDARPASQAGNPGTPWKTLAKLGQVFNSLQPGDSVLFMRGDVFEGSITITKSGTPGKPIVFSAYGNGSKPVLSGFKILANWATASNGIVETTDAPFLSTVNMLLVNGQPKALGRYPNADAPNKGYLMYEQSVGSLQIIDKELPVLPNWTGAEVVIRKNRWVVDRNLISLHAGPIITYVTGSHYSADPNFGYFIQNGPKTLDVKGEWYFNSAKKKLGILLGTDAPATQTIKASVIKSIVFISNQSNLVFTDLVFEGANENALEIIKSQQIAIINCGINFSGSNAITASGSNTINIEKCNIQYSNNNALTLTGCSNTIIKNNKINSTGTFAGMGKGDAGSYEAILMEGNNNLVELNEIDSTGYIPITFSGNAISIKNNFITNFAFVKDDGGGIYTYNGGATPAINSDRHIVGNIILNGLGAGEGTPTPASFSVNGIYLDDKVNHVEVVGNTVANCNKYGIFIHNANALLLKNNTAYNNGQQLGMVHDNIAPDNPITNVKLFNNILFSKSAGSLVAEYRTIDNGLSNFGSFDSNYYCRPLDDLLTINTSYKNGSTFSKLYNVEGWKNLYGKDKNSAYSPVRLSSYTLNNLLGGNKFANGNFDANISGLYTWSAAGNSAVSWVGNGLDGGALKVTFSKLTGTYNRASVIIKAGGLVANKKYLLRFTAKGTDENKFLQAYLRQSVDGYKDLSERKYAQLTALRNENEILFTANASEANASIVFAIEEQQAPIYLDNIQLYEADATPVDTDENILFQYNATATQKNINLSGAYVDVANNAYSGSFNLAPFTSKILMRQTGGAQDTATPSLSCTASGSILHEHWDSVAGNNIIDIPLEKAPSATSELSTLEISKLGNAYGTRIRGYICPPQTGGYTFFIAGDDAAGLWLSTDSAPAGKVNIASLLSWTKLRQWDKYPSQKSAPIALVKGNKYYLEILHKQGSGDNHVSVAWQLPDGTFEAPVSGTHLSPFIVAGKESQTISFAPVPPKTVGDTGFSLVATATSGLAVSFSIVSGPATLTANRVTITGAGTVVVSATQAGNNMYTSAATVIQNFVVAAAPNATCGATGFISFQQWYNAAGNTVADIPLQAAYSATGQISIAEFASMGNNYGTRLQGYICAPQTGAYTFFIAGDDAAELWVSTDESPQNKARAARMVSYTNFRQWDKFASQKSAAISLIAGQRYFIEVLHKQGGGGGSLSVGWQLPDGTNELPVPGGRLAPYTAGNASSKKETALSTENIGAKLQAATGNISRLDVYPNPFKNTATISFYTTDAGQTMIDIVDIQGRVVRSLYKGIVAAGSNKKFVISGYLQRGIYFVKLSTASGITSKKIVVEK